MRHDGTRSPDGFERHARPIVPYEFIVGVTIAPGELVSVNSVGLLVPQRWATDGPILGVAVTELPPGMRLNFDVAKALWTPPRIMAKSETGVTHYLASDTTPLRLGIATAADTVAFGDFLDDADMPTIIGEDAK